MHAANTLFSNDGYLLNCHRYVWYLFLKQLWNFSPFFFIHTMILFQKHFKFWCYCIVQRTEWVLPNHRLIGLWKTLPLEVVVFFFLFILQMIIFSITFLKLGPLCIFSLRMESTNSRQSSQNFLEDLKPLDCMQTKIR